MKIRQLHINRFGHFNECDLVFPGDGLQVIYGPNEAGKTTLLELAETKDLAAKVAPELTQVGDGDESFDLNDPARQVGWLRDAEALVLSYLIQDSGGQS